ncbi:MAG: tRNA pseudouridine(13) synthase TruD, partial [Leptospiraceae bacterium]|nr:tRNA pseudouridine(13) synthase TruD [Leptospiraceae bacterium]
YGGKKDRHAFTRQLVTVEDSRDLSFNSDHFSFKRIGCSDRPMIPELIRSNRFRLCVRNILERELPSIESAVSRVNAMGFPNYFDDQRFASYHPVAGFAFLSLFRGDPESALRFTLLSPYGGEKTHAKKRKKAIHDLWGQWKECLDLSQTSMERMVFQELKKRLGASKTKVQKDKVYLETMDRLPREELSMGFS